MTHRYLNHWAHGPACDRNSVASAISRLIGVVVIAGLGAMPVAALAQSNAAAPAAPATAENKGSPDDTNEIVVTALKQRQLLSDVPATLAVITEQRIAESRIEQVEAVAATVSNVNIRQTVPGVSPVITIRGVGLDDFSTTNSPATGVSIDEVSLSSIALLNSDFFDIGRIEVLKGPQGTLYGRNTVSGALNIISAKPVPAFDAAFQAGYGNFKTFDASGMVNAPLGEGLAVRLSGKTIQQREGFYTSNYRKDGTLGQRDLGRRNVILGRVQLGYNPTKDLEVIAKYEVQRVRSEIGQYKGNFTFKPGSPFVKCAPFAAGMLDNTQCTDAFGFTNTNPDPFNLDIARDVPYNVDEHLLSLNAKATVGRVELASVTGYIAFDRTYRFDVDTTPREELDFIQRDKVHAFSQELRAFTKLGFADVQVGGFYSYDRAQGNNDNLITSIPLILFGFPAQNGKTTFDQKTRSAAGFTNVIWHLTDALNLTTGLRYTWENRHYIGGTSYPLCPISPVNVACARVGVGTTFIDRTISDRNWSWKVGLDYKIGPDALIYASASKGTKSGGFVTRFTTTNNQLLPYRPESLIAYEIGAKADFNRTVTVDAAAFYYRFKDVQTNLLDGTLTVPLQRLSNINGTSELYGAEASATVRPVKGLTLQSNLGLLHTRLATFATGPVPFVGNRFSNAPNFTFDALARYEVPLGANLRLIVQGDTSHQGFAFKDASNNPFIVQRAYWLFNARAAVATQDKRWEFAVWGKNLSDTKYIISGGDTSGLGVLGLTTNNPRTYGASVSWKY